MPDRHRPSVEYRAHLDGLTPAHLTGFFAGWPNPPSPETHLELLRGSDLALVAFDLDADHAAGYITALTDGVLTAYIPLLEVLPAYRGQGIGSQLVGRLLATVSPLYTVSLHCDVDVEPFYARLGLRPLGGMALQDYTHQCGRHGERRSLDRRTGAPQRPS